MKLYTVHSLNVLAALLMYGRYACDGEKSECIQEYGFGNAYDWMVQQMTSRIGHPPEGVRYPVWAFVDDGYFQPRNFGDTGELLVKIELEITDDSKLVISNFCDWHFVLNDHPLFETDEKYTDFERLEVERQEEIKRQSWQNIFKQGPDKDLQVTFWELRLKDVTGFTFFRVPEEEE